jgi:hypothetical protein
MTLGGPAPRGPWPVSLRSWAATVRGANWNCTMTLMLLVALWSYSPPLLARLLAFIGITAWASYQVYYH